MILAWLWSARQTQIITWIMWNLKFLFSCEFQVSKILDQSQAFTPDYCHMGYIHLRWYSFNKMIEYIDCNIDEK